MDAGSCGRPRLPRVGVATAGAGLRGQAAWMASVLAEAGVPAMLRISPGQHTWQYAMSAFADALTYLEQYWQQYTSAEAA